MFATRPPPPSGRPPSYAIVNRMAKRSLRGPVIFFGVIACIWALVWASDAFRSISDDQKEAPTFVKFDIVLGVLYSVGAAIEIYGIFAAVTSRIPLVRIYAYLSFFSVPLVAAVEILRLVLHIVYKSTIINVCFNDVRGGTITTTNGNIFHPTTTTTTITDDQARSACNTAWNNAVFRDVAWLLVALILGTIFALFNFAFYRQLIDPSLMRTQAPSSAYQMNATRNAFGYRDGGIQGYNPYRSQTYGPYVPAYDGAKLPGYDGTIPADGDEKAGYTGAGAGYSGASGENYNPFSDPPVDENRRYAPPPGLPPTGSGTNHDRDEGFDPAAVQAAMEASKASAPGKV